MYTARAGRVLVGVDDLELARAAALENLNNINNNPGERSVHEPLLQARDLRAVESKPVPPPCVSRAVLKSIKQLASADRAVIVRRDAWTSASTVVGRCTVGDVPIPSALDPLTLPPPGESRWLNADTALSKTVVLAVGLSSPEEARAQTALLLFFENGVRPLRTATENIVPAIRTLAEAHLALAAQLHAAERQQRAAMAALQQNECGVVVLGADRSILLCNDAAEALLAGHNGLTMQGGTLRPNSYHDALRFHTAIDCVVGQAQQDRTGRGEAIVMLLPRPDTARALIAVITPAPADHDEEAVAIIYLLTPDRSAIRGAAPICAALALSQVETRLVTHLVEGFSISDAAAEMRIKPATARGYLKSVFAKTGTRRQVDLINLLLRYLRAVRGDFDFQAG
jgi:DNA-binding CsgD family transcriptional regulator/PAS domain-containing protein